MNIFKDASDLDVNLIQGLKSREIIETQLLAQADENKKPLELTTDFGLKRRIQEWGRSCSFCFIKNRSQSITRRH